MRHIYIIQNKINYKIYVGQTKNVKKRFSEHKYDSQSKEYPLSGIKGRKLISKYNISETNMYRIIKNQIWKVIL